MSICDLFRRKPPASLSGELLETVNASIQRVPVSELHADDLLVVHVPIALNEKQRQIVHDYLSGLRDRLPTSNHLLVLEAGMRLEVVRLLDKKAPGGLT
jgi:hypothetical protein